MPILPCEPDLFPDGVLSGGSPSGRTWYVAQTKPRQEKSLARELFTRRIGFYLPTQTRVRRIAGRRRTTRMPLFAGYVFVLADRDERLAALTGNRIVRTLAVHDQVRLRSDLRQIQQLLASGLPVDPADRLGPGTAVEVREGPLAGLTGRILRTASGGRFVVEVDFIQRGAAVWLDEVSLAAVAER